MIPTHIKIVVEEGDTLSHIGTSFGVLWDEIYYSRENSDFRALRPDPNLIYPGDTVYVPLTSAARERLQPRS